MRIKSKTIWSACMIVFFLLIALASTWDDFLTYVSTNVQVAIKDCMAKPEATGKLKISLNAATPQGVYLGAHGEIYITHQKVNSENCTFEIIHDQVVTFILSGSSIPFVHNGFIYAHDNSQDLIRVEVNINATHGINEDWKSVQVLYYNQANFNFNAIIQVPL